MRGGGWYVLKGREPVAVATPLEWAKAFEEDSRRVAADEIGEVRVSTVFLGLDHGWGDGPPVLFETMVFGGKLDQEQERYCTYDEAEAGHKTMVERVRRSFE